MLIKLSKPLILASSSKIRQRILQEVGLDFKVMSPLYDEDEEKKTLKKMPPKKLALFLAKEKALSISRKFPKAYVIGSDQVCEFQKNEISKSTNAAEALAQLTKFNGKVHFQNNAVVVALNGKIIFENFSRVELKMRKMSASEIKKYVEIDQPWGCAGSYKYEALGKHLFEKISGDYFSVLGLAIQPLLAFFHLKKLIKI
jgi:septum formation protein